MFLFVVMSGLALLMAGAMFKPAQGLGGGLKVGNGLAAALLPLSLILAAVFCVAAALTGVSP